MKRLILCFDGTWNAVADPNMVTNVVRLANMVTVRTTDGIDQITYYNSGVGSGGPIDQFLGGVFGYGLKSNVKRGLAFLSLNYEEGDEIYVFGFSRGAYTARALAAIVGRAGIPLDISQTEEHWRLYQRFADLRPTEQKLKRKGPSPELEKVTKEMGDIKHELIGLSRNEKPVEITCVGVWDTVGSYGVPGGLGLGALPRFLAHWVRGFRDTQISSSVQHAFHAMALDEMRRPFAPTFWTRRQRAPQEQEKSSKEPNVEQAWFAGVHSNVGGGYDNCGLSDMALAWMVARVGEQTELQFSPDWLLENVWPCSACTLYRTSYGRPFGVAREILPHVPVTLVGRAWRAIMRLMGARPRLQFNRINEHVHWSVKERCGWDKTLLDGKGARKYAPPNLGTPKTYSQMLEVERLLLDRNHAPARLPRGFDRYSETFNLAAALAARNGKWDEHCSLREAGLQCQCERRYGAASAQPEPATRTAA